MTRLWPSLLGRSWCVPSPTVILAARLIGVSHGKVKG
jgi:hypothetical protein